MSGCCGEKFTRQQWFTLVVIGCVHFASAICVSLQAPFYPEEAEAKNATATEYGFVFGIYELVAFISSPLLGNYIDLIGAKLLLNTGIFTAGTCAILFGLLHLIRGHVSFIVLSFVVRIFEAIGSSAAVTSAFAITAATFPNNVATTFATLEIFYGLGYIAGPTLGGILFAAGGYILPFVTMGCVLLLVGITIFFFLPPYKQDSTKPSGRLIDILKVPAVLLDSASITALSICIGYYAATLEPHIRHFKLSPVSLGLVFITHGATYAAIAPLVGRLCDTFVNPRHLILLGSIFTITSVLFVGPAPFIPAETTLPLVLVGLVFLGFGMASVLVSAFIDAIRSSVAHGFPDDISTYGLVSGLWAAAFSLGDFIGPSAAGFLDDMVGFRWGSLFVIAVQGIVVTSMFVFIWNTRRRRRMYTKLPPPQKLEAEKETEPLKSNWSGKQYGESSVTESLQKLTAT